MKVEFFSDVFVFVSVFVFAFVFVSASEEYFIGAAFLLGQSRAVNMRSSLLSDGTALCGYQPVSNGWAADKIWEK